MTKRLIPSVYYFTSLISFIFQSVGNKYEVLYHLKDLFRGKGNIKVKLKSGQTFLVRDLYDVLALKEVYFDGIYNFIFSDLKPNTTFIDIGSYIGDCVVLASQFPLIHKIVAFEPYGQSFELARHNINLNNVKNCSIYQKAVSVKGGHTDFFVYENKGQSGLYKTIGKILEKKQVAIISFSDVMSKISTNSIVMKSDCEGEEYEILLKTPRKILRRIERMAFEYHNESQFQEIKDRLQKIGYSVTYEKHPIEKGIGTAYAKLIT